MWPRLQAVIVVVVALEAVAEESWKAAGGGNILEAARGVLEETNGEGGGAALLGALLKSDGGGAALLGSLLGGGQEGGGAALLGSLLGGGQEGGGAALLGSLLGGGQEGGGAALLGSLLGGGQEGGGAALLGSLLGGGQEGGGGALMSLLGGAGHRHDDDPTLEDEVGHARHSAATDILWSWLKQMWERSVPPSWSRPLARTAALFTAPDGSLQPEPLFASLENNSFRRRWVRELAAFVAHWVKHLSSPRVRAGYFQGAAGTVNSILDDQDQLDANKPLDQSLPILINKIFKNQFGLAVESSTYIKPTVKYVNDLLMIGDGSVSQLSAREIEDKLSEMLNNEVIESVLRVWRAHKYSMANNECDKFLVCHINSNRSQPSRSDLKAGITKIASLVSSWFLSGHTGTSFLELYNAAVANDNCEKIFPADCAGFHEEDIRMTTEYAHNEL